MHYEAGNVVLLGCSHVREMRGESGEVVRRTRSDEAESAVLAVVGECGVEPAWFVERWRGGTLVCPMVFERAEDATRFEEAAAKAAGDDMWVVDDEDCAREVAELFSAEWERVHARQMEKYRKVLDDAAKRGFTERLAVCERAKDGWREYMQEALGRFGGKASYTAYEDERGMMRYAVCVPEGFAKDAMAGDGVTFRADFDDVDVEMAALVIAQMRKEEAVPEAVRDGIADAVRKADAAAAAAHAD